MFPDIAGEQGLLAVGHRVGGITGIDDLQSAVRILDQPRPAGAEVVDRGFRETRLEVIETAECLIDCAGKVSRGCAATIRAQTVPVEGVIPDLGSIVEDAARSLLDDVLE